MSQNTLAVLALVVCAAGCPDPCALGGGGCNVSDDCNFGEVCRKSRDFEGLGCAVLAGTCINDNDNDLTCGSIDDCEEGQCCDPESNLCIGAVGYVNVGCDENSCADCDETPFGERCGLSTDCRDDEVCSAQDANIFNRIDEKGVCQRSCDRDDGCPADERCENGGCSVPIGTPCVLPEDVDSNFSDEQCLGLECSRLDAAGDRGPDGYCTGSCSTFDPAEVACPAGLVCEEGSSQCRRP